MTVRRILLGLPLIVVIVAILLKYLIQDNTKDSGILKWADASGEFKRQQSQFRDFISTEPGAKFAPEKDRYHLYVSYACPWGEC